jgi:hypothetical protein
MGQFSDDGQWWWDGARWIATSQVVLPDLPITAFEQSGKLKESGTRGRTLRRLDGWRSFALPRARASATWAESMDWMSAVADWWHFGVPVLVMMPGVVGALRSWRLEQLALATTYLLGTDEPMLAGEAATLAIFPEDHPTGKLAVVVTKAHLVVFRIDVDSPRQSQPRWIVLARRSADVNIEFQKRLMGLASGLTISDGNGRWTIRGFPGLIKPEPVLQAWRQSASAGARR